MNQQDTTILNDKVGGENLGESDCALEFLKSSRFNFFVEYDNETVYGHNILYKTTIKIPRVAFPLVQTYTGGSPQVQIDEVERSLFDSLPPQWADILTRSHFLIRRDIDEIDLLRFRYFSQLFANNALSLVILPTLWCNFNCPYCFENKKVGIMKPDVEDDIISWLQTNYSKKRYIHVAWFGGEPLLGKRTIERLTKRIKEFCASIGAIFGASLTTNGLLFNSSFHDRLDGLSITHTQITLDGAKEAHDQLRGQRNGRGSFDTIFKNILTFCDSSSACKLTLRVNCGDSNIDSIEELLRAFPSRVREKADIFFRWIWPNAVSGFKDFAATARGTNAYKNLSQLYDLAVALGWRTSNPCLSHTDGYCEVDYLDMFQIDPEGNIFLCSHSFDKKEAIGSVRSREHFICEDKVGQYLQWYSAHPFSDPDCLECKLLPICFGGCRASRVSGRKACIEEKFAQDVFIRNVVDNITRRCKHSVVDK